MKRSSQTVLILPGALADADLAEMPDDLSLQIGQSVDATFDMLDDHIGSLHAAGQLVLRTGRTLTLLEASTGLVAQKAGGNDRFVADLKDGSVKAALKQVPPLRSLLRIGSGTVTHRDLSVTDDERKTLVRAHLTTLKPDGRGMTVTIAALQPLRGYDKATRRLREHLEAAAESPSPRAAELSSMLFPDYFRYSAKPDVAILDNATAWQTATDIITVYLQVARENEAGVIADHDTEFLHDYRVALRKVRSVLSLFKGVYPEEQTADFKRKASELMSPTGRLRDLDVYLLAKDEYFAMVPSSLHEGLEQMFKMFRKERRRAHRAMAAHLDSARYQAGIEALQAEFLQTRGPGKGPRADAPVGDYARQLIWKRYRKVCRIAREITADTPDEQVHELRIGCKKLRYLMEFFAPLYPAAAVRPILKPLKRLQDNLGLFNDYSVQQAFLKSFMDAHEPIGHRQDLALAQSIGALIAVLHERQQVERARIMASFDQFDGPDVRDQFRSLFNAKEA